MASLLVGNDLLGPPDSMGRTQRRSAGEGLGLGPRLQEKWIAGNVVAPLNSQQVKRRPTWIFL